MKPFNLSQLLSRSAVDVRDYGGVADFSGNPATATDNSAALVAAINAASAAKVPLHLSGIYYSATPIVLTNLYIDWQGTANGGIAFGATNGVSITQADYTTPTYIANVDFYTVGTENGTGLSIAYSAADSLNNRNLPRCFLDELSLRGWNIQQHGWTKGLYTKNVHAACLGKIWAIGRRNLSAGTNRASFGNMVAGLHYDSDGGMTANPSDSILSTVHVYNSQTGVLMSGEAEGTSITACKLVGVWKGIFCNMASARPGLQVYENHINCFDFAIDLYQQPQAQIFSNLLYKFELSDGLTTGLRLRNCDLGYIGANTYINSATDAAVSGQFDCVEINNSIDCRVDAQLAQLASRIIHLTGGTQRCRVRAQTFAGTAFFTNSPVNSAVVDDTVGPNFIAGRWASAKSGAGTITNAGVPLVSVSTPVNVRAGQRFRVSAMLAFTKGATGGTLNYSIAKSSGTATVVFYQDATSLSVHGDPAAGAGGTMPCNAEMTVTADGSLQLTMTAVSLGSNATLNAGDAQITLTEIE